MTRLAWVCDICGEPIPDGAGYVTIDRGKVFAVKREWTKLDEDQDDFWIDAADLLARPDPFVPWQTLHRACDNDTNGDHYWIDVARLRSLPDILRWTAHLMEKNWISNTTWTTVLRRVAGQPGLPA